MLTDVLPHEKIFAEALALPEPDRIRLARELLESLDGSELRPEDEAELWKRMDEIDLGGETVDGAEVLAGLHNPA